MTVEAISTAALKGRLDNWGRWSRHEGGGGGHCGSAEYRYLPPRPDDEGQARRYGHGVVDVDEAEVTEAAVCAIRFKQDREFLRMVYVDRLPNRQVCRHLKIPGGLFEPFHLRVLGALTLALEQTMGRRDGVAVLRRGSLKARSTCNALVTQDINAATT